MYEKVIYTPAPLLEKSLIFTIYLSFPVIILTILSDRIPFEIIFVLVNFLFYFTAYCIIFGFF